MSIDENQVERFKESTEREYNIHWNIPKYVRTHPVSNTDGSFRQIGLRFLVEEDFFDSNSSYSPEIIGLGDSIANGEEDYFINIILKRIRGNQINIGEIDPERLGQIISNNFDYLQDVIILVSIDFKYKYMLRSPNEWIRWDNAVNGFVFMIGGIKIPVHWIHDKVIKNHIIILNKNFGIWEYVQKNNKKLDIKIGRTVDLFKIEVLVRSLVKFRIVQRDKIKLIKLRYKR